MKPMTYAETCNKIIDKVVGLDGNLGSLHWRELCERPKGHSGECGRRKWPEEYV